MTYEFKHPKHYAALRAELRKLQASSSKQLASSSKPKPEPVQVQEATSVKPQQTSSDKLQATNNKQEVSSPK